MVLHDVAEAGLLILADRRIQRYRHLSTPDDLARSGRADPHLLGDFLLTWLSTQFLAESVRNARQPVNGFECVQGEPNGMRLVGQRPPNTLANPPRCVSREPAAPVIVESVDSTDQADVAFLD